MERLYDTETLAELLNVSQRTIRRERKSGRLPFVRVRGQIRYRESDVRAYLEQHGRPEDRPRRFASLTTAMCALAAYYTSKYRPAGKRVLWG